VVVVFIVESDDVFSTTNADYWECAGGISVNDVVGLHGIAVGDIGVPVHDSWRKIGCNSAEGRLRDEGKSCWLGGVSAVASVLHVTFRSESTWQQRVSDHGGADTRQEVDVMAIGGAKEGRLDGATEHPVHPVDHGLARLLARDLRHVCRAVSGGIEGRPESCKGGVPEACQWGLVGCEDDVIILGNGAGGVCLMGLATPVGILGYTEEGLAELIVRIDICGCGDVTER
jgi:hypothetical protein